MKQLSRALFVLLVLFFGLPSISLSEPLLYYNIVPHASGSDCTTAKNNLTGQQLFSGRSDTGVPTVASHDTTYTVESFAEAQDLCAQVGGTPAALVPPEEASAYQPSAHPWFTENATSTNPNDDTCAESQADGRNYTYLQLAGHCN